MRLFYIIITLCIASLSGCVTYGGGTTSGSVRYGGGTTSGSVEVRNENIYAKVSFNDHDAQIIKSYYARNMKAKKKMPPGLAKRDKLPPGLQKQLERNQQLPPGLQGRYLPRELERELTPVPRGFVRLEIGRDIIILDQRVNVVVDVLYGINP